MVKFQMIEEVLLWDFQQLKNDEAVITQIDIFLHL